MLMLSCIVAAAGNPPSKRLTFGMEWGYSAAFHYGKHYNFFAPDGYRVIEQENHFTFMSNAEVSIHVGCNLREDMNLSLYAGYAGIGNYHHGIPLSLRFTKYWEENAKMDRWLTFIDLGSGISLKSPVREILRCKLGGGYRISLSKDVKLDFLVSLQTTYTHPEIIYADMAIDRVNRNNAYVSALSLGVGLDF